MFETLKHWFESLTEDSKLFDHRDDEILHVALASVLYHLLSADPHGIDQRDRREFDRVMREELDLNQAQIDHLYAAARSSSADIHGDLHTIHFYLKHNPAVRMTFMRKLLQLVDVHGAHEPELALFYETLHEVFPEVKALPDEAQR